MVHPVAQAPTEKSTKFQRAQKSDYLVIEIIDPSIDVESLNVDSSSLVFLVVYLTDLLAQAVPSMMVQTVTYLSTDGTLMYCVFTPTIAVPGVWTCHRYTVLGPYWKAKLGRHSFKARQCSKGETTLLLKSAEL